MATYKSSYTGPQIDQAVSHAVNMDVNPTAGHTDRVVSSGGVKSALDNKSDDAIETISTVQSGTKISSSSISYKQFGRIVQFSGYFKINAALAVSDILFSGVKNANVQYFYFPCFCDGQGKYITLRTNASGGIVVDSLNGFSTSANETYVVTATYLTNV